MARLLLALVVCASGAACSGDAADEAAAPDGLMTVEQVQAEIEATKARTPLPEGAVWRAIELGSGGYEAYYGGSVVEFQAMCAWLLDARAAEGAGDQARSGEAVAVLRQIPGWRLFTDPAQFDESSRKMLLDGIEAAVAGNFAPLDPFIRGNCLG